MRHLFDPPLLAGVAQGSAMIGSFLLGPVAGALLYVYMYSGTPGSRLDCGYVRWYLGYDIRDECAVDIAERVRCGGAGASCISLSGGAFGGYPPTFSALIDDWVYVGTVVLGMGAFHVFFAIAIQAVLLSQGLVVVTAYLALVSFWVVVGTSSYGGDTLLQVVHYISSVLVFVLVFVCHSLMLWHGKVAWGSQYAYLLHSLLFLSLLALLGSFAFKWVTYGTMESCDEQYLASGMLSIAEQTFLSLYSTQVGVMFYTSTKLSRATWLEMAVVLVGTPC